MRIRMVLLILSLCIMGGRFATNGWAATRPLEPQHADDSSTIVSNQQYGYRLLAANKTSTLEREMNEAAVEGFRFEDISAGDTAFGGSEVAVVMSNTPGTQAKTNFEYKLLATNRTETMQKELQVAGNSGYLYRGQAVSKTAFGGKEVIVILERDLNTRPGRYEYKLLATLQTSTMQKELKVAGGQGFLFLGLTVAQTAFGGKEVVAILGRQIQ